MRLEPTRRDVGKVAVAFAIGAAGGRVPAASGQQAAPAEPSRPAGPADGHLASAKQSPEQFMLSEPAMFTLDTDSSGHDLVITSARDEHGDPTKVYVPSRVMRISRADVSVDEFTKQGGVYWQFRDKSGQVKLNNSAGQLPGPPGSGQLVMLVRDEQAVRVYTLMPDFRC